MRLTTFLKKNAIPIFLILVVVGLLIYMTQRKEGFTTSCKIQLNLGADGNCDNINKNLRDKNKFLLNNGKCNGSGSYDNNTRICSI